MELTQAANIWWMDIDRYVRENFLKEISSPMINEPSTGTFHPHGLYSETIFGQVGSKERISMLGYVNLNCKVLAPVAYLNLIAVASWYQDLMESKVYAIWDPTVKDYVPCKKEDPNARTGFYFFLEHVEELNLRKNDSKSRNNKIEALYKARHNSCTLISKWIVAPAGWRDVKMDNAGNMKVDAVNKLYTSLIITSKELRANVSPEMEKFFDVVKYHIQLKVVELFQYWKMFWEGKTGFGQANYSKRNLALGTRNVITAASLLAESPDDPRYIKHNETHMPLYQLAKGASPVVVHALNTLFTAPIFTMGSVSVPAIDPDTLAIEYIEVTPHEVTHALDSKSKYELINSFLDKSIRHDPVSIRDINNKIYWLWMVYDLGTSIYMFRNIDDLEKLLEEQASNKNTLTKEYYHLTTIDIGKTPILEPRIPQVNSDLEDLILPRVSLSPTIDGCLIGIAHHFTTDTVAVERFNSDGYQDVYVYKVEITDFDPVKFKSSEEIIENKLVFDAELTKECWSLTQVRGTFLGAIRVYDKIKTTYEFIPIRDNKKEFYTPDGKLYAILYEYEWITGEEKEIAFAKESSFKNLHHVFGTDPDLKLFKKEGLLSPRVLYEKNRELFHKTVYTNYHSRASTYHGTTTLSDADILDYLDHDPRRKSMQVNSSTIFFSLSKKDTLIHVSEDTGIEISIAISTLKKEFSKCPPILIDGTIGTQLTWKELEFNWDKYQKLVEIGIAKQVQDKSNLTFKHIPHIAINCGSIPFKFFTMASTGKEGILSAKINKTKIRPLTKIEMLYIATYVATRDKYLTATRFPAVEVGSIYPSRIVAMSTDPSRVVTFKSQYSEQGDIQFPQYPVIDCNQYVDSAIIHPSKTKRLTADFDGDKMSFNIALSKEATLEAKKHLASAASVISPSMEFYDTLDTMAVSFVLHSLTRLHSSDAVIPDVEK